MGFCATNDLSVDSIAKCAATAVAIAKPIRNAGRTGDSGSAKRCWIQTWKTPITKNAFTIPVKEKLIADESERRSH